MPATNNLLLYQVFYILATYKVTTGQVSSCTSEHSWQIHSAAPLGNLVTGTMTLCEKFSEAEAFSF